MPRRTALPLVIIVGLLALPSQGLAANSTFAWNNTGPAVTITPAGDTTALTVELFRFSNAPFCGGFIFPPCDTYFEARSAQGLTESPDVANCTAPDNGTIRCDNPPFPVLGTVGGTPGNDAISTTSSFFCFCATPLTTDGGAGDDLLTGGTGDDNLTGGVGNDTLASGGGANDVVDGGDGDDTISVFASVSTITGGPGNDVITADAGSDTINGTAGKDRIESGAGDDTIDGGDDNDTIDGGPGNDTLRGGGRRDTITPGVGTDTVEGGESTDAVSYEERTAGTTIAIGGGPVSGESGENDTIAADIENVIGGAEGDRITGSDASNDIEGGGGNDDITPARGADFVDAGAGDDIVNARDGVQDQIECGAGNDRAVTDEFDAVTGCETVQASRELMADVDNDGIAAPTDCDDRNAGVRPGLPDRPGNGVDEDCREGDAPFARVLTGVSAEFVFSRSFTRFTKLTAIDVPPDATIEVRCIGGRKRRCFTNVVRRSFPKGASTVNLTSIVRRARLRPKAVLEIRILRPDTIGKVVRRTVRRGKAPTSNILCQRPGATAPAKC